MNRLTTRKNRLLSLLLLMVLLSPAFGAPQTGPSLRHEEPVDSAPVNQTTEGSQCLIGVASGYACNNINMLSNLTLEEIGGGGGTDGWGWHDEQEDRYYAILARTTGTAFIDITDAANPVYIANLPSTLSSSSWRDVKVYQNHAYVVADNIANHGMQVFDMTRLRGLTELTEFTADTVYNGISFAHNLWINEESGFAYALGSTGCSGGLHMIDIGSPKNPVFAGCYSGDGYSHDAQCVIYNGPDTDYTGQEICFASNEDTVTVVDVTDKNNPQMLSRVGYPSAGYTHQGWLTDDQHYFIFGDELDERRFGFNTRTLIMDVHDLDAVEFRGAHIASTSVIDHNMYIADGLLYQANYSGGIRILKMGDLDQVELTEVGFFDTEPDADTRDFEGAWSVYPFFGKDRIVVADINRGLFVLSADIESEVATNPLNGTMSGQWAAAEQPDQGITLLVGENTQGRFAFYAWYTYLNGEPFWFVGNAQVDEEGSGAVMPALQLDGLGLLDDSGNRATQTTLGTVEVQPLGCDEIEVTYNLGTLGSGTLTMNRLANIEAHACAVSSVESHGDHTHD